MIALHTALQSTLIAAVAAIALTACDRGADDSANRTTTGSADTRSDETARSGDSTSSTSGTSGTSGTSSYPGSTGTTTGSAADTPAGGTPGTTTGAQSPESTMSANPPAAGSTGTAPSSASLAATDRTFVETAARHGLYELTVAKLAADKASDPAVRSYAAMLVNDHTAANERLKQVASSRNVELPSTIPADKQKQIDKLSQASGPAFDREFVQMVGIKDHQADIALFQKASREAKDPQVKSFAESTLSSLQQHLDHAQKLPMKKG